jgi:ABC transporter substrate binding protein
MASQDCNSSNRDVFSDEKVLQCKWLDEVSGPRHGSIKSQPACVRRSTQVDATSALVQRPLLPNFSDQLSRSRVKTRLGLRLPTMFGWREYIDPAGLMSYGPNIPDLFRRAGEYVDKILRGAKAGELPVEQPTKFELGVNLTVAKALGLKLPESFLLRADEMIE